MVRNYSWSDDTDTIRVYVPIPGVVREGVTVQIGELSVDLRAQTPMYGLFTMALRKLFDKVDVSKSSFKVRASHRPSRRLLFANRVVGSDL